MIQRVRSCQNESYKIESERAISAASSFEGRWNLKLSKNYLKSYHPSKLGSWKPAFQRTSHPYKFGPIHIVGFAKMGNPPPDLTRSNRCRLENNLSPSSLLRRKAAEEQCSPRTKPYLWNNLLSWNMPSRHLTTSPPKPEALQKTWAQPPPMCKKQRLICFVSSPRRTSMDFDIYSTQQPIYAPTYLQVTTRTIRTATTR